MCNLTTYAIGLSLSLSKLALLSFQINSLFASVSSHVSHSYPPLSYLYPLYLYLELLLPLSPQLPLCYLYHPSQPAHLDYSQTFILFLAYDCHTSKLFR